MIAATSFSSSYMVILGRLRPDFLDRCQWDPLQHACTGFVGGLFFTESSLTKHRVANKILDGRKSFPSGHSSSAFVGMTFVVLFLAGKTAGLCFSVSPSPVPFLRSRLTRLCLVLSPFAFSTWVAITRIQDNVCPSSRLSLPRWADYLRSATTRKM
jgi:diacylglycerol diphosphate phosphatase / phosphatidate phosphatase